MNQILSVEKVNKQKKRKERKGISGNVAEAVKIVRFFAIALIIFGIFNIGTGVYAIYKKNQEIANTPIKPIITIEQSSEKELTLIVESETVVNEVYYQWNDEEETRINGNGRTIVEEKITLPAGENTLNVRATNASGQTEQLQQVFEREANIIIQVEEADPNIKVKLEGKDEIAYMTYRWNDEEETKIDINATTSEQEIKAIPGENMLTIVAVDVNNVTEELKQPIEGLESGEPVLDVSTDGNDFIIDAKDAKGITRVEFIINESIAKYKTVENEKEFHDTYPLEVGVNKLEITVYNVDGTTAKRRVMFEKKPSQ